MDIFSYGNSDFNRDAHTDHPNKKNDSFLNMDRQKMMIENYFEQISAIPRLKTDRIIAFLKDWADSNGFKYGTNSFTYTVKDTLTNQKREETGENIWIDVPATQGYENYPNVILQGHLDMVCKKDDKNGKDHNFETDPIDIIANDNFITANGTTLGADNGIGIAIMMAIATGTEPHGPLRLLMTGNEEKGCEGAESLDPSVLNSDYLINLDYEDIEQICYSSAGNTMISINKINKFLPEYLSYNDIIGTLNITGLPGGHSGLKIHEKRLPANVVFSTFLQELIKEGMKPKLSLIKSGNEANAISDIATVVFSIQKKDEENVKNILSNLQPKYYEEYGSENLKDKDNNPFDCKLSFKEYKDPDMTFLREEDSASIINFLNELPQGVLNMLEGNNSLVETSSNTGQISLDNLSLEFGICSRSCNDEKLKKLRNDICDLANNYFGSHELNIKSTFSPSWNEDPNSSLINLIKEGYDLNTDIEEVKKVAVHAGLECSIFALKKLGIHLVSMGPTIDWAHTTKETLHTDTLTPCMDVVNYCLKNINVIDNIAEI